MEKYHKEKMELTKEEIHEKNELIYDIVFNLMECEQDSQEYIKALLIEALSTRSLEDLKEINI